jgi:hypothetical protein
MLSSVAGESGSVKDKVFGVLRLFISIGFVGSVYQSYLLTQTADKFIKDTAVINEKMDSMREILLNDQWINQNSKVFLSNDINALREKISKEFD